LGELIGIPAQSAATNKDPVASVQRWRTVIDTQMHFNRMLMRTRFTGVSMVMAVFGAAAVGLAQYPVHAIVVFGVRIHISAAVIVFGLSLLATLFVLDYFYFYRMLLAVVQHAEEMEIASQQPGAPIKFGLTCCISNAISRKRAAVVLLLFYAIPLVSGLLFLLYLVTLDIPNVGNKAFD
jgi:hypothetical protein